MPHYELLYLISNQFSEDELTPIKDKIEKIIVEHGGTISSKQSLGKKRLAYKIKQFRHGYYELVEFDAPAEALPKINDLLRLASDILRHQIIKCEVKTPEELAKEAKVMSELNKIEKETEAQETRTETERPRPVKTETVVAPAPETAKDEKDKVELSDLDDKLNQILDTDNLL